MAASLTVAFTVSGQRQQYLRQALGSWERVRGVQDARLLFCIEPDPAFPVPEFGAWAGGAFRQAASVVNAARLGCVANTRMAMSRAFGGGAGFAVLAEEDVEVSSDVLEYFAWAAGEYAADPGIAAVCAHTRASWSAGDNVAVRLPWFSPLIWGTWKSRWEDFIGPGWGITEGNPHGWDARLRIELGEAGLLCLFPARSRSLHIGETSTLFTSALSAHMYPGTRSTCYEPERPPQRWREVTEGRLDIAV